MKKLFDDRQNEISSVENKAASSRGSVFSARRIPALVFMALLLVAIAGTFFVPTFSWTFTNREAGNENGALTSDTTDSAILPYSLYIKQDDTTVNVYTNTDSAAMNSYDSILGRNDYSSAYIVMPVYGVSAGNNITFTITANGALNQNGNASGTDGNGKNILMEQYLSNIIYISCANITASNLSPDSTKLAMYNGAKSWFDTHSASTATFVQYSAPANSNDPVVLNSKNTTVSFSFPSGSYTIESNGMVYIYFKIDYKYELVDAYVDALRRSLGGFKLGEAGHAEFTGLISGQVYDLVSIDMLVS